MSSKTLMATPTNGDNEHDQSVSEESAKLPKTNTMVFLFFSAVFLISECIRTASQQKMRITKYWKHPPSLLNAIEEQQKPHVHQQLRVPSTLQERMPLSASLEWLRFLRPYCGFSRPIARDLMNELVFRLELLGGDGGRFQKYSRTFTGHTRLLTAHFLLCRIRSSCIKAIGTGSATVCCCLLWAAP